MGKDALRARALGLVALLAVGGCAGYSVQEGGTGTGYDVYRPEPYLHGKPVAIETASGKTIAYQFDVVWLPNYSKRYRVRSWAGLGRANFTFTFTDGWKLTQMNDQSDNTNVLTAVTDLAKHLLPPNPFSLKAGVTDAPGPEPRPNLEPVLYKIEFDECTGSPTHLRRLCPTECPPFPPPVVPGPVVPAPSHP
jgi:hypothetical protein